jgi:16S rRNA processing protein RimM
VNQWVTVAILGRARGNRGELTAIPLCNTPERLERLQAVFLFGDGSRHEVEEVWLHDGRPVFKFRGIDSISDAEPWQGAEVRIPMEERAELAPGEFYQSDLVGCEVFERSGAPVGRVTGWQETGGAGLLEVTGDGGEETLVPFARSICVEIDPAHRRIVVDLPEGLKELNRP